MLSGSIQNLLLALIVIVPGFIATQVAISLGVIRTKLSKSRILITSLAMSLVVVSFFFGLIEQFSTTAIAAPNDVERVFFTPTFRPGLVLALLGLSGGVGAVVGVVFAADIPLRTREIIWELVPGHRQRSFYEPWEGTLEDAARVQVLTSDGALAVGSLYMWSDDDKEQQIALRNVEWHSPSTDGWVNAETDIELFTGKDILRVTVVDTMENAQYPGTDNQ